MELLYLTKKEVDRLSSSLSSVNVSKDFTYCELGDKFKIYAKSKDEYVTEKEIEKFYRQMCNYFDNWILDYTDTDGRDVWIEFILTIKKIPKAKIKSSVYQINDDDFEDAIYNELWLNLNYDGSFCGFSRFRFDYGISIFLSDMDNEYLGTFSTTTKKEAVKKLITEFEFQKLKLSRSVKSLE